MNPTTTTRRGFVTATAALGLSLKYGCSSETPEQRPAQIYRGWEDLMRNKWTWDRVVRGSRGINCTGHCAFNLYVRNGIVWREEQQGEYGASGDDVPDYGPRGCQKGLRQAKQMYGKQRVLYPMKRLGERGEGRWQRISWDQALTEIADKFIDYAVTDGPNSISYAMGTAMILKRVVFGGLFRFGNITGCEIPETFAGVGDLPVGAFMTLGHPLPGDNMAAVYKSKCCLVWVCNPAHPIANGLNTYFEIEKEEMYSEPFQIPLPDETVFISWFEGGEVFRSGLCYRRGNGKIFYFRPGHQTFPVYYNSAVQKVISNSVHWVNSEIDVDSWKGKMERKIPIEPIKTQNEK